ncbi:MAG: transglutaminase domain-containing protein [Candidatus Krumholzibacteriia bacterium]
MERCSISSPRALALGALTLATLVAAAGPFSPAVSDALAAPGDVAGKFATPGRTPTGLAFDGHHLWVADRLTDELYALDPATGEVVRTLPAPGFIPRGLAWDGAHLWVVDGEEKRIVMLDPESGTTLASLESPATVPQGLAWDGRYLWLADDADDKLMQISTADGTTVEEFAAPMKSPTGLTWWQGYLWSADRLQDRIYLVDPRHGGEVVLSIAAPGPHAYGLAADGDHLWVADYQDDVVYRVVAQDGELVGRSNGQKLDLLLTHEFRNYGPGELTSLDVYIAVPSGSPMQDIIVEPSFSPEPDEFLEDRWQQKVAHWRLTDLPIAERQRLTMDVRCELFDTRWYVFPHEVGELEDIPRAVREQYLVDEDKYRIGDPRIVSAVKEAVGDETNPYWMMRNIHRYIRERLHYELAGGWNVAPRVLERGNGSCSEYTFLFISMCRAAGIPARYVGAVVVRGDAASSDDVFHRWSQVYLPPYGWIHIDPQGGDKELPGQVAESIGALPNRFLITTEGGGASEYLGWNYNYEQSWTARGPVKVHEEAVGEWSPAAEDTTQARLGS